MTQKWNLNLNTLFLLACNILGLLYRKIVQKESKRFARGVLSCATDDMPLSPKTNSVCPAGCRIASLACHGQIIPWSSVTSVTLTRWPPNFPEGTVLNRRTWRVSHWKVPPRIPELEPLQPLGYLPVENTHIHTLYVPNVTSIHLYIAAILTLN